MKVRILKLKEDLYLLQVASETSANWEGLGLTMNFFGKVTDANHWSLPDNQIRHCSYKSKSSAIKALTRYKGSKKFRQIQGAELLEKGEYEIVFEDKI